MPTSFNTILVLRFSSVGDIVLTAPALEAARRTFPNTRLVFVTKQRFVPLVEANPHIDRVVALQDGESLRSFRRRLAAEQPDGLLDLHGKLRGKLLRTLVPAHRRGVWLPRRRFEALKVRWGLDTYKPDIFFVQRYHHAIEALAGVRVEPGKLRYYISSQQQMQCRATLRTLNMAEDKSLIGMAPSALWYTKQWPAERFAELAKRLLAQGRQVILTGGPQDTELLRDIEARAPGVVNGAGHFDLATLGPLIDSCQAFVTNDSGPLHIARALGVPTLAFFGSTSPLQFDFTGHKALFAGVECSPCSLYGRASCPKGHFECMSNLSVETAEQEILRLLDGKRRLPVVG